jgi:hypothetical protein
MRLSFDTTKKNFFDKIDMLMFRREVWTFTVTPRGLAGGNPEIDIEWLSSRKQAYDFARLFNEYPPEMDDEDVAHVADNG